MALWTEIIDPPTLTGYARASLETYELRKGSLNRWMPNRPVGDVVARFVKGQTGLVNVAKFRSFDAEPEIGKRQPKQRVTLELPALGENRPITEYEQLRARNSNLTADEVLITVQNETDQAVRAVADQMERMRGIVLSTGRATIDQDNFQTDDDFGRPANHTVTAATLWSAAGADPLEDLVTWMDLFEESTGDTPGSILMPRRVFRAMSNAAQFRTTLIGGAERRATDQQVRDLIGAAGLPEIYIYDRRVQVDGQVVRVIPDDALYMLPSPVDANDWQGTDLGATFWGRTLTSTAGDWGIQPSEQPGIVAGLWRNPKPPMGVEIISDAIGLPVLANAVLSLKATVL